MAMGMARVFGCSVGVGGRVSAAQTAGVFGNESVFALSKRFASKKAGGSTKNGRDSESKRLGVKKFGGCVPCCLCIAVVTALVRLCGCTAPCTRTHTRALTRLLDRSMRAHDSQSVVSGNIIIRQRGTKYHPGRGVGIGKDHTIFATRDGFVRFWYNVPKKRQEVSVKDTREPLRVVAQSSA